MLETLKFTNLKTYNETQADKDIMKWEYQQTMDQLYQELGNFSDSRKSQINTIQERRIRDQSVKEKVFQKMDNTHVLVAYNEIISHTKQENIKKVTIKLLSESLAKPLSDELLYIFKDKLQKAYDIYNKAISNPKYKKPFLERDGNIMPTDAQLKATMLSISSIEDDISQQTGIDLNTLSKQIDVVLNKIEKSGL